MIGTPFYIMSFLDGRDIRGPRHPWRVARGPARHLGRRRAHAANGFIVPATRRSGWRISAKATGFYPRQISTWKTICTAQAATKDAETGEPVGQLPRFDNLIRFFSDQKGQPADRGTVIHGDYKIDNLVFHKTEPRVIGILE